MSLAGSSAAADRSTRPVSVRSEASWPSTWVAKKRSLWSETWYWSDSERIHVPAYSYSPASAPTYSTVPVRVTIDRVLETEQRLLGALARLRQQPLDLRRQRLRGVEQPSRPRVARVRRIVDQQHDPQVRIFLQRRRQQRHQDHPRLLLIRGHEHRRRRSALGEELVDHRARRAAVIPRAVVEPEPPEQVGDRRRRQQADRRQEADRLQQAGAAGPAVQDLAVDDRDHQRQPGGDGDRDRRAAERHRPV